MERSHSLPSRGHSDVAWDGMGNPWYSDKARTECLLAANRPMDLPTDTGDDGKPIQNSTSGMGSQPSMQFVLLGRAVAAAWRVCRMLNHESLQCSNS